MVKYCRRHRTHFCPCVKPELYDERDARGDAKVWDDAENQYRAQRKSAGIKTDSVTSDKTLGDEEHERGSDARTTLATRRRYSTREGRVSDARLERLAGPRD